MMQAHKHTKDLTNGLLKIFADLISSQAVFYRGLQAPLSIPPTRSASGAVCCPGLFPMPSNNVEMVECGGLEYLPRPGLYSRGIDLQEALVGVYRQTPNLPSVLQVYHSSQ